MRFLVFIPLISFLFGCASSLKNTENTRYPAQAAGTDRCAEWANSPGAIIHHMKRGESRTLTGYNDDKPFSENHGCPDGKIPFISAVPNGSCLAVAIQDKVGGEYTWNVLYCEE